MRGRLEGRSAMSLARAAVLLAVVGIVAGCGDDLSLVITRFLAVDPKTSCIADATSKIDIDRGLLDVGVITAMPGVRGYIAVPVVQNNRVDHSGTDVAGRDDIQLSGV